MVKWPFLASVSLVSLGFALAFAGVELVDDPPPVAPPKAGTVRGTLRPPEKVTKLSLLTRLDSRKTWAPAKFDRKTGEFAFTGVPGDADYDLHVETADGRTIEGIDLAWMEARMVRMGEARRRQLGLTPERRQPFTADDANSVLKWVADWKDFLELKRPLYVCGHGRRATALVELMRTRDFHAAGGAYVWRVELWYFQNEFGGWDRLANTEKMLQRRRCSPAEWGRIDVSWLPELSVHVDANGASGAVDFTIPARTDPSCGRPAASEPELKTPPHVLGLDDKPGRGGSPARP